MGLNQYAEKNIQKDLIVIGAGIPGIIAAVQAARLGLSVALINNRGYFGGNSSAELGIAINGALGTAEFNFYGRESGIIEELLLENQYKNEQGNRYIWDSILLDFIKREKNIEVFLNTNIDSVMTDEKNKILYVSGSQTGSEKRFYFDGDLYIDDTGDGTVGYLAGAEYRVGCEGKDEFNEKIAPDLPNQSVIPSTLIFHAKDTGKPVRYFPPEFAVDLTKTDILKYRQIPINRFMSNQWYYEVGGNLDQIADSEKIIQMHRELVYGIWDYIKNSGKYQAENYNFEYVSCVPGKRESRRLAGDYILKEEDIVRQNEFDDVVGYGGWSVDLHAFEGFFSSEPINRHYYLKGIYQIPYRCTYSKNITNLFMAGRCISTTHVAFGSTRVSATLSTLAQAVGAAAYLCKKYGTTPRGIYQKHMEELQQLLLKHDQYVIGRMNDDVQDKARYAKVKASSVRNCELTEMQSELQLANNIGISLPIKKHVESIYLLIKNIKNTVLQYEVCVPEKKENYCPEIKILESSVVLEACESFRWIELPVSKDINESTVFVELYANHQIQLGVTREMLTGCVFMKKSHINSPQFYDIQTREQKQYMWENLPEHSICFKVFPKQELYPAENIVNGVNRVCGFPNMWISDRRIENEHLIISFDHPESITQILLYFDSNHNYGMTYNTEQKYQAIPQLVKDYTIYYKKENDYIKLKEIRNNYQRLNWIRFNAVETDEIKIIFQSTNGSNCVGVFGVRVY